MSSLRKKLIWAITVIFLVGGGYYAYTTFNGSQTEKAVTKVHKVVKKSIKNSVDATGVVKPSVGAEIIVGARVSGNVLKQNVKMGDPVKKGDLIAVIDPRAALEDLKIAQAELSEIRENYPGRVEIEKAKLESAKKSYELAKWGFENREKLYNGEKRFITEDEYKKAKNEAQIAEITLDNQRLTTENLQREYGLKLKSAKARYEQAKIQQSYTNIYATISGIISFVSTQEGETVVAGMNAPQFVKILDPKRLENRIFVDETEIGRIKVGMEVEFNVDTYKDRKFKGTVAQIYPTPTLQNNIVYFTVVVSGFEGVTALRPEMTTHNKVILQIQDGMLVVPNGCIKWKNGKFVVIKKIAERTIETDVQTGISDDKFTVITDGLQEGDEVVETLTQVKKDGKQTAEKKK